MPYPPKRRLLARAILVGLVCNWIVIVALALTLNPFAAVGYGALDTIDPTPDDDRSWYLMYTRYAGFGTTAVEAEYVDSGRGRTAVEPEDLRPAWTPTSEAPPPSYPGRRHSTVWEGRGWPFVAAWARSSRQTDDGSGTPVTDPPKGGARLGSATWSTRPGFVSLNGPRVIPYRPYWPGLLGNVAIYAGAFLAVRFGVVSAWRMRRIRRGHCPACQYDRVGDYGVPCPECGWALRRPDDNG